MSDVPDGQHDLAWLAESAVDLYFFKFKFEVGGGLQAAYQRFVILLGAVVEID